jgi:hypothetical protein
MRCCFFACLLLGCGGGGGNFPPASSSAGETDDADGTDGGDANGGGGGGDCGDTWTTDGSGEVQPGACLAWGPLSADGMSWYAAASEDEGILGGCTSHCPEGNDAYCSTDDIDGRVWRLPSQDEVIAAAQADPPMDELGEWIWTRDSDPNMNELAWKASLSDGGAMWSTTKDSTYVRVRCVSDP